MKNLQTIRELCVSVVDKEVTKVAMDFGEKCDWEPSHSQYYTMANILLYLNDYKTFKQFKSGSWADLMSIVTDELSQ